jgi:hypothetical protein
MYQNYITIAGQRNACCISLENQEKCKNTELLNNEHIQKNLQKLILEKETQTDSH